MEEKIINENLKEVAGGNGDEGTCRDGGNHQWTHVFSMGVLGPSGETIDYGRYVCEKCGAKQYRKFNQATWETTIITEEEYHSV